MRPSAETVSNYAESLAPELETAMGGLDFPFYKLDPELRMRIQGACGIVSETLRQDFCEKGYEAELRIRPLEIRGFPEQHVITVVPGETSAIIVDGSFTQLMEPFGPSSREALVKSHHERFPDERVVVFEDGQQAEVAEWMVGITRWATGGTAAGAEEYYRGLWDLSLYTHYEADSFIQDQAARLRRQLS